MFNFFPDEVIEEKVRNGLTNELIYFEHRDVFDECQKLANEASDKLTPRERRFISEMKACSIILPFSQASRKKKHMPKGEMVTLLQLIDIVGYLRERGLSGCIGCDSFHVEIERSEDGRLVVHTSSIDAKQCNGNNCLEGPNPQQLQLQKPL